MATFAERITERNRARAQASSINKTDTQTLTEQKTTKPSSAGVTSSPQILQRNESKPASDGTQKSVEPQKAQQPSIREQLIQKNAKIIEQNRQADLLREDQFQQKRVEGLQSGKDIVSGIDSGSVWTSDIEHIKQTQPALYEDYLWVLDESANLATTNAFFTDQEQQIFNHVQKANENFLKASLAITQNAPSSKELYEKHINTPEITAKGEEVTEIERQLEQIDLDMQQIEDDVRAQLWWGASESYIRALTAKKQKDLLVKKQSLQADYRKSALDYNSVLSNAQMAMQFEAEDLEREQQQQMMLLQTQYNMTMAQFDQASKAIQRGLDREEKEYWHNKSLNDQVELMRLQDVERKQYLQREYNRKKETGQLDKDNLKWITTDDGTIQAFNPDTYEVEYNRDPNATAGFQFNMNIKRTGDNVAVDINNPWNITADGFKDPTAKANYGKKIWATGTYKSPNWREYYVFDSQEAWARALRNDIKAKIQGRSSWATPDTSLQDFVLWYSKWPWFIWTGTSAEPYYMQAIQQHLWGGVQNVDPDLPIKYINPDQLAEAVALAETGNKMDISWLWFTQQKSPELQSEIDLADVYAFNNSTFKPQDLVPWTKEYAEYSRFLQQKSSVMQDPNASITDIMYYSQWGKPLIGDESKKLTSYNEAFTGIEELSDWLLTENGWPILGTLKTMNPYDVNAQVINSLLDSITPWLARGVYGEVGVLTDKDIERYRATLPNLKQTDELQKVMLAMNIKRLMNWYTRNLKSFAANWRNIAWFEGMYESLRQEHERLMNSIWGFEQTAQGVGDVLFLATEPTTYSALQSTVLNFTPYLQTNG